MLITHCFYIVIYSSNEVSLLPKRILKVCKDNYNNGKQGFGENKECSKKQIN